MYEIRKLRRDGMNKPDQQRLRAEDEREERELQTYVAHAITKDMLNGMPGSKPQTQRDNKVTSEAQQEAQWHTPFVPEGQQDRRDAR